MQFYETAECMNCHWHGMADDLERVEAMYPSRGLDPDWREERACPECGSTWISTEWGE